MYKSRSDGAARRWLSLISEQKLLTGHRCWGRFSWVFHYSSVAAASTPGGRVRRGSGERRRKRTSTPIAVAGGVNSRVVAWRSDRRGSWAAEWWSGEGAVHGEKRRVVQENRRYFCRAKNGSGGGGGGSKTMRTPPALPPSCSSATSAADVASAPASSTRPDAAFPLAERERPDHTSSPPPAHARRRLSPPVHRGPLPSAKGLLMFLGRRRRRRIYQNRRAEAPARVFQKALFVFFRPTFSVCHPRVFALLLMAHDYSRLTVRRQTPCKYAILKFIL